MNLQRTFLCGLVASLAFTGYASAAPRHSGGLGPRIQSHGGPGPRGHVHRAPSHRPSGGHMHRAPSHRHHSGHRHHHGGYYHRPHFHPGPGFGWGASYYYAPRPYYYSSPSYYYAPRAYYRSTTSMDAQAALARRGYYYGEIDGVLGPRSRSAIARFQSRNGLRPTGTLDRPTLVRLGL